MTLPYRNRAGTASASTQTYVFATTPVALSAGKTVSGVRLPSDVAAGGLHVFAIGFGA